MVGERGFEPPTPWSRTRCSTRLSHSPTVLRGDERKTAPGAAIRDFVCCEIITKLPAASFQTSFRNNAGSERPAIYSVQLIWPPRYANEFRRTSRLPKLPVGVLAIRFGDDRNRQRGGRERTGSCSVIAGGCGCVSVPLCLDRHGRCTARSGQPPLSLTCPPLDKDKCTGRDLRGKCIRGLGR